MKSLSFLIVSLFLFQILSFAVAIEIKPINTTNWIEETVNQGEEATFYFSYDIKDRYGGVSLFLEEINSKDIEIYMEDYPKESSLDDYTPSLKPGNEYKLHQLKDKNYYMVIFNETKANNMKILTVKVKDTYGNNAFLRVLGIKPTTSITTISKELSQSISIKENIPMLIQVNVIKSIDRGLTYVFFVPSQYKVLKIVPQEKINEEGEFILKKTEVLKFPKNADPKARFTYYAIIFSEFDENTKISCITTDYQTLYFADKEERTNDRTYDIKIDNSYQPLLALGEYVNPSKSLIYFEEVLGELSVYYSNTLFAQKIKDILPNDKNGIKLSNNYIRAYSDVDIISVYCDSLCMFNLHIISMETVNKQILNLGETSYILLNTFIQEERRIEIGEYTFGKAYYEIKSIKNKSAIFAFLDEEENQIGKMFTLDHISGEYQDILPKGAKYIAFQTILGEDVLIITKIYEENTYTKINTEGQTKINANNIIIPFKKSKDYYKIIIDVKSSGNNFLYNVNYGEINYVGKSDTILPTANRTLNEHHFDILNPYLNLIQPSPNNMFFYIAFTFDSIDQMTSDSLKIRYVPKNTALILKKDTNHFIVDEKIGAVEQKDDEEKKMLVVMSKCNSRFEVDTYLSYNGLDLIRAYVEKNILIKLIDDRKYSFDIRFERNEQRDEFPPVHFYYSFLDELSSEYDMYDSINGDFEIQYMYPLHQEKYTNISIKNPLAKVSKNKFNFTYNLYTFESLKMADTCNINNGKLVTTFKNAYSTFDESIEINRKNDTYLMVVLTQNTEQDKSKPEIYYTPIKIFKFVEGQEKIIEEEKKKSKVLFYVCLALVLLVVVFAVIAVVWIVKYKKSSNYEKSIKEISGMKNDEIVGTSLVNTNSEEKQQENLLS